MNDDSPVLFDIGEDDKLRDGFLQLVRMKSARDQLGSSMTVSLDNYKKLIDTGVANRESKRSELKRTVTLTLLACDELEARLKEVTSD